MTEINNFLSNFQIDIENTEKSNIIYFFQTIIEITNLLNNNNINYCFCSSVGLILHKQKIKVIPKDIDMIVERKQYKSLINNVFKENNFKKSEHKYLNTWIFNGFLLDISLSLEHDWASEKRKGFSILNNNVFNKNIEDIKFKYQDPKIIFKAKKYFNKLEYERYGYFLD